MSDWDDIERDPDWIKIRQESEKREPTYKLQRLLEEISIDLRYGIPSLKFIGQIIIVLLIAIVFKLYS